MKMLDFKTTQAEVQKNIWAMREAQNALYASMPTDELSLIKLELAELKEARIYLSETLELRDKEIAALKKCISGECGKCLTCLSEVILRLTTGQEKRK